MSVNFDNARVVSGSLEPGRQFTVRFDVVEGRWDDEQVAAVVGSADGSRCFGGEYESRVHVGGTIDVSGRVASGFEGVVVGAVEVGFPGAKDCELWGERDFDFTFELSTVGQEPFDPAKVSVQDCTAQGSGDDTSGEITFTATVANTNEQAADVRLSYRVNGEEVTGQGITLQAGEQRAVEDGVGISDTINPHLQKYLVGTYDTEVVVDNASLA